MIRLQIAHIDTDAHKQTGVYPIFSSQNNININRFQKAYIYSILKSIRRDAYLFSSWENRHKALLHICNFLNSSLGGDFVFVDEIDDNNKLPYDLTSDVETSYKEIKYLYDSIEYVPSKYAKSDLLQYESEIINKYDDKLAEDYKSRAVVDDNRIDMFKIISRKVSEFYFILYRSAELSLDSCIVYLDFIPQCFPKLSIYSPVNLAFQAKNFEFLAYLQNMRYYHYNNLKEQFPIGPCLGSVSRPYYVFEHNFFKISIFILSQSNMTLSFFRQFRALHFAEYEKLMEFHPNTDTRPGSLLPEGNDVLSSNGNELLRAEYKASIRCNDISNLNYLIHRFRAQLVDMLKYRKNLYTMSDNIDDTPACVLQSTKDFVSCLTISINSKLREEKAWNDSRPWGYNAVTGAPIYEWQLKDIDSQRW